MNYCSHCGEKNKPTSKFCTRCGTLLVAQTSVPCAICGVVNDSEQGRCANCGAQLNPRENDTPRVPASESTFETKPFLAERRTARSKRVVTPSEARDLTKAPAQYSKAESAPIPQWFAGMRPTAATPVPEKGAEVPPGPAEAQVVPDWLDELEKMPLPSPELSPSFASTVKPEVVSAPADAPPVLPPMPDWLRELQSGKLDELEVSETKANMSDPKRK